MHRKIEKIVMRDDGGAGLLFEPDPHPGAPFATEVDAEFVAKHAPKVGGYYIRYRSGGATFSAEPFLAKK